MDGIFQDLKWEGEHTNKIRNRTHIRMGSDGRENGKIEPMAYEVGLVSEASEATGKQQKP